MGTLSEEVRGEVRGAVSRDKRRERVGVEAGTVSVAEAEEEEEEEEAVESGGN